MRVAIYRRAGKELLLVERQLSLQPDTWSDTPSVEFEVEIVELARGIGDPIERVATGTIYRLTNFTEDEEQAMVQLLNEAIDTYDYSLVLEFAQDLPRQRMEKRHD